VKSPGFRTNTVIHSVVDTKLMLSGHGSRLGENT
jgi:hypothetical protein